MMLHTDDTILYKDDNEDDKFLHKGDAFLHIYLHYDIKMPHSYTEFTF